MSSVVDCGAVLRAVVLDLFNSFVDCTAVMLMVVGSVVDCSAAAVADMDSFFACTVVSVVFVGSPLPGAVALPDVFVAGSTVVLGAVLFAVV